MSRRAVNDVSANGRPHGVICQKTLMFAVTAVINAHLAGDQTSPQGNNSAQFALLLLSDFQFVFTKYSDHTAEELVHTACKKNCFVEKVYWT